VKTKVLDTGIGSASNPTTRRKPVSADGPSHQRTKGGFEELNISSKPE
jgi:hypothetical protein